ncbi:MAG: acyl-phosphate glycerol 3-phosphate acyltransferase [Candidatus Lindowbacteria bacterium RIFCSPLOWO2_12_FULL_62_27]|nr:MAG: acyl-phosphate glycerol 3-phosphate acyltransferase [Candidatus Lindowbacteria bacterium RIFCSPLOWO2_12_FULL_62_27]
MTLTTAAVSSVVAGFLLGSLPPGYWIGRFVFGKDLKSEGSGNIGATNAYRVLGPAVGSLVLILDVLKGAGAVWISRSIGGADALAGLAAILGHTFSPFLRFRGGKGVATGLGVFLCLALNPTLAAVAVFAVTLLISHRMSPASCLGAITLGVGVPLVSRDTLLIAIVVAAMALVLVRHRSNLRRLIHGEEPPLF